MEANTPIPHPAVEAPVHRTNTVVDSTKHKEVTGRQSAMLDQYMIQLGDRVGLPQQTMLTEKPIHTAMAYMLAAGRTRKEVALAAGVSEMTVTTALSQPWFKSRLKEITDVCGRDMVKAFFEGEVMPSLEVLRTIRDNPAERGATRVAAINSILDRGLGKPIAYVESKATLNIHTASAAADQVQFELEKIDRELLERGVKNSRGN